MTTTDPDDPSVDARDAIAAELAAIGEPALSDGEPPAALDADEDVRTVGTLAEIATADPSAFTGLDALAQRRVWKRLEGRVAFVATPVVDPHESAANRGGGGWRSVVAGLAVAAGVILLPRWSAPPAAAPPSARDAAALELGQTARDLLDSLGDQGGARARSMADEYAARLGGEVPGGARR